MYRKPKLSHNDILRRLLGVPRYTSARTLFVNKRQDNVDVLNRKQCYNLITLITELLNLFLIRALSKRLSYLLNGVAILK